MNAQVFDSRICRLGEGPLWHPERGQFFWFDIKGKRLLTRTDDGPGEWHFDEHVSAAGWLDHDRLLIASERALFTFNLETGARVHVHDLEADNPVTRSNDGRADPWGGFWIGTMGFFAEPKAGAIYRLYRGELRKLYDDISVTNSICFAPDRSVAYYSDTLTGQVMRVALDPDTGWPAASFEVHLDLTNDGLNPDGAVTDSEGNLWIAEWGACRVSCYDASGTRIGTVSAPALQTSCPAFGGPDLRDLYITSAATSLGEDEKSARPYNGATFIMPGAGQGVAEPKVIL